MEGCEPPAMPWRAGSVAGGPPNLFVVVHFVCCALAEPVSGQPGGSLPASPVLALLGHA